MFPIFHDKGIVHKQSQASQTDQGGQISGSKQQVSSDLGFKVRAETLVSSSCPSRAPLFTPSCCWKCFALRSRNGGPQDFGICLASESYSLSSLPAVGPSLFQPTHLGNYFLISCLCACPAASQSPCFCSATAVTEGPYPMRAPSQVVFTVFWHESCAMSYPHEVLHCVRGRY